jgi:hypothetical protein
VAGLRSHRLVAAVEDARILAELVWGGAEERQDAQAYIVALTLATVSVVLLVVIEAVRRRIEGRKSRT